MRVVVEDYKGYILIVELICEGLVSFAIIWGKGYDNNREGFNTHPKGLLGYGIIEQCTFEPDSGTLHHLIT